ncbi:hypothetical protein V2J09_005236 [Rumex salicifolius]
MNLPKKESLISLAEQSPQNKGTSLNPNAAEFVPFTLNSSNSLTSGDPDAKGKLPASGAQGKQVLDRLESSVSINCDEEAHQYWHQQLPDDLTPDFRVMGGEDLDGTLSLSLAGLSLLDVSELNNHIPTSGSSYMSNEHMKTAHHASHALSTDKMRYPPSSFGLDPSSANFLHWGTKSWNKPVCVSDPFMGTSGERTPLEENRMRGNMFVADSFVLQNNEINPLDYLTLQFPGFAAQSLADVYFANDCDLQMTIEILSQLELQVDGDFNRDIDSKTSSAPNLSSSDFPSLLASNNKSSLSKYSGDEVPQSAGPYISDKKSMMPLKTTSFLTRGPVDFASAVRKLASHDSGVWKHDGNMLADCSIGSTRTPQISARSNDIGPSQGIYADKLQWRRSSGDAPGWLETGEAVANLYSELREEARDHARLRNAFFEQARQAYIIGNKALAKELSAKGHLHNDQMKAAHSKAQESIYRHRNPISPEVRGNYRVTERLIDLHGLHVSEAIHVLKHELGGLRSVARSAEQRLQVYICVGTGHHTKGSRTPARLPVAVQRYLLEEEGLQYFEPQPGLLRVEIC